MSGDLEEGDRIVLVKAERMQLSMLALLITEQCAFRATMSSGLFGRATLVTLLE